MPLRKSWRPVIRKAERYRFILFNDMPPLENIRANHHCKNGLHYRKTKLPPSGCTTRFANFSKRVRLMTPFINMVQDKHRCCLR